MNLKLNCIMLVDDNGDDNFYHERIIKKGNYANVVLVKQSGIAALEYLRSREIHENDLPDIIFLDINMPKMNGWEFLEEYKKLDKELQSKIVVVMLTTSDNPDDIIRAEKLAPLLKGLKTKPLTKEMVKEIIDTYFKDDTANR